MDMLPITPASAALSAAALWVLVRYLQMLYRGHKYGAHQYIMFSEETRLRGMLPGKANIPGVVYGNNRAFRAKYSEFMRAGKDAYMQVAMNNSRPNVYIADPRAIKTIATQKQRYGKDVKMVGQVVGIYGDNIASTEGEDWKRHRKETQRAFNEKSIRMVWSETETIMNNLFKIWDKLDTTEIIVLIVFKKLALLVISTAGFGRRISWDTTEDKPSGGRVIMLIPTWAKNLTEKTRAITTAFPEFGGYLDEMVAARRSGTETNNNEMQDDPSAVTAPDSLFNILLSASDEHAGKGEQKLSDRDVVGNAFLFLFAGHETTAHTLSFCLGLLALYPKIQQEVYEQIKQVIGSRDKLEYSDMNDLNLVECVFWEALRLYPVVTQAPKIALEDSVVSVARNGPGAHENTREDFFIPKGANIWMCFTAVHHNPTYWSEPEKFRPKRFLEPHNKDAFLAFSTGSRSCLGRKFAETEGMVALAMLIARYDIKVDEDKFPSIPGESILEREARLLDPVQYITLAPARLPLVFNRRF
ncbi:hypothetical protein RSOLAG22IIIB_04197 [Rhizoctonia solani]|uniref:Cytochrome P450 n=1 Tax=Rhizoctonia solani TaxID=456999 RepID=A0A0K6FWF9_9AGAM|nr:hypothetical protein RSOLAG22IIIB_04197 [Rhizoctonia solani]